MKKAYFLALTGALLAMSIQPATAQPTLAIMNKTSAPAIVTVTYHTALCKDDRNFTVLPGQKFPLKPGLCTVKSVSAQLKHSGIFVTCVRRERTGAAMYTITADHDLSSCHVD